MPGDVYRTADCRYVNHSAIGVNISPVHKAALTIPAWSLAAASGPVCVCLTNPRAPAAEVQQAIDWARGQGYQVVMVTFTFPHKSWQSLGDLLARQADAFKRLRKGRPWDTMKGRQGFKGLIRSLEVTHGANGWHPHP